MVLQHDKTFKIVHPWSDWLKLEGFTTLSDHRREKEKKTLKSAFKLQRHEM